jgi:ABC-type enterobactin transport system permease subunit
MTFLKKYIQKFKIEILTGIFSVLGLYIFFWSTGWTGIITSFSICVTGLCIAKLVFSLTNDSEAQVSIRMVAIGIFIGFFMSLISLF